MADTTRETGGLRAAKGADGWRYQHHELENCQSRHRRRREALTGGPATRPHHLAAVAAAPSADRPAAAGQAALPHRRLRLKQHGANGLVTRVIATHRAASGGPDSGDQDSRP